MKLFSRYNRTNIALMAILFLCSGIINFMLVRMVLIHELDEALDDYKNRINVYIDTQGKLPGDNVIDDTYIFYEKVKEAGRDQYSLTELREPGKKKLHPYRQLAFIREEAGIFYRITIAKPLEGTRLMIKIIVATTLGLLLIVILVSLILNRLLLGKIWKPFYHTIGQLKGFKIGKDMKLGLQPTKVDEFSFLNSSLEQTVALAEQEYRILKEFTENASHEMQTPLAIVRSKLDLVIQQEGLSDLQAEAIQSAYAGIKRLDKLNRSLLLLARIENRQFNDQSVIDLKSKITEKLEQLQELMQESSVTVHHELKEATIHINEMLLDILLNNLLSNAARHNIPSGRIGVFLGPGLLAISNTGQAQTLDPERLFRRFNKEEQHTTQHGLGLSIIKQICDQSGITIRYDRDDRLHIFTLSWLQP